MSTATVNIELADETLPGARRCGECQLCCKLVPTQERAGRDMARLIPAMAQAGLAPAAELAQAIPDFDKPAGQRCPHQRHHKGCAIYATRPFGCRFWNCRWLVNDDTADLRRPDRSHVVLDLIPDYVTLKDNETGESTDIEVVQVWVDPGFLDAWRDPTILAYLDRRGRNGIATLIRYGSGDGFTVFPPSMSQDHEWHEVHNGTTVPQRTDLELLQFLEGKQRGQKG